MRLLGCIVVSERTFREIWKENVSIQIKVEGISARTDKMPLCRIRRLKE